VTCGKSGEVSLGAQLRKWIGVALIAGTSAVAVARTLDVEAEPARPLAPARRDLVGMSLLNQEPRLRAKSDKQFPYDRWSQDDAFGAMEQSAARAAAARERVDLGSVLDALDAAMHAHPSAQRKAGASPCKPRPFYD
jgi:hypothetical protein